MVESACRGTVVESTQTHRRTHRTELSIDACLRRVCLQYIAKQHPTAIAQEPQPFPSHLVLGVAGDMAQLVGAVCKLAAAAVLAASC